MDKDQIHELNTNMDISKKIFEHCGTNIIEVCLTVSMKEHLDPVALIGSSVVILTKLLQEGKIMLRKEDKHVSTIEEEKT